MASNGNRERQSLLADTGATCEIIDLNNGKAADTVIPVKLRREVGDTAKQFLQATGGHVCVLLAGKLQSDFNDEEHSTENAVLQRCLLALGDPGDEKYSRDRTIDLVLDTLGGSLDSAFRIILFLSQFTSQLRVYVPRRAKSAGTLIAVGCQELYLAPFAELGPLDTQIPDPRDPTHNVSALDLFQTVDYVRGFGIDTLKRTLVALTKEVETGLPLSELLGTARTFANSCTESMLSSVKALDFGAWGRTLQIGERYTKCLLERAGYDSAEVRSLSYQLVYGYTHHPYAIDIKAAKDIGLHAHIMKPAVSGPALEMVKKCADLEIAVGVWEAKKEASAAQGENKGPEESQHNGRGRAKKQETERENFVALGTARPPVGIVDVFRNRWSMKRHP